MADLNKNPSPEALLELGRLYAERCDNKLAEEKFRQAEEGFYQNKDFNNYRQLS